MKKVLLLCQQGIPFELSPTECQLVDELKRKGYKTYVFNCGKISCREIRCKIDYFIDTLNYSTREIRKKIKDIMPEYIIAFTDNDTRILYPLLGMMKKTAFIYYNLEIYTPEREERRQKGKFFYQIWWRPLYLYKKIIEIIYTKKCRLFVIQDKLRKKISAKYFIRHSNTMLIPNSYPLFGEDDFGIDCCGIIYSGLFTKLRVEELIKDLHKMPDFPLTFSGQGDEWFRKEYKILHASHPSIKLFEQSLLPQKYSEFLKPYAVGLVWYSPTKDENEKYIGMSSGKFFKYLSMGKPVIVSKCPGISEIVDKYKLGIVVHNVLELIDAYERIINNYSYYKENIRNVYKEKFDFTKVIQVFLKKLEEI